MASSRPLALAAVLALFGCSASSATAPIATTGDARADEGSDALAADDSGAAGDSGTAATDGGATTDGASSRDAATDAATDGGGPTETLLQLHTDTCFDFASGSVVADCTRGEIVALAGAKVDLMANDASTQPLCELPGTYPSLASVPSDYANCTWIEYVEGFGGLADHGLIVRDAGGAHHWRVRIVSNELPTLVFAVARVD